MLVLVLLAAAAAYPTPPEHTPEQIQQMVEVKARAQAASAAATPEVLSFLDSSGFRAVLRDCCPEIQALPAEELLRRYRKEAQVTELAHALPLHREWGQWSDHAKVTMKEVRELPWFPNNWQISIMEHRQIPPDMDLAQQEVYGLKAFVGKEPTWAEAANRMIYAVHNMRRMDIGSTPFYGDFTVVFNSTRLKDSVLIAPFDSGFYTMCCLSHDMIPEFVNCSAWPAGSPVGTLDYLDHLILPSLAVPHNHLVNRTMLDSARDLFSRSAMSEANYQEDLPPLTMGAMAEYLESNILANPRLPEGVKFGIAKFGTLFGTADGRELQLMADRFRWPLFWAFGTGDPEVLWEEALTDAPILTPAESLKGHMRIADPENAVKMTNASVPSGALANFEEVWQEASAVRATRNATKEDVAQWWSALNKQLQVAPVSAMSCSSPHESVGVTADGCIGVKEELSALSTRWSTAPKHLHGLTERVLERLAGELPSASVSSGRTSRRHRSRVT